MSEVSPALAAHIRSRRGCAVPLAPGCRPSVGARLPPGRHTRRHDRGLQPAAQAHLRGPSAARHAGRARSGRPLRGGTPDRRRPPPAAHGWTASRLPARGDPRRVDRSAGARPATHRGGLPAHVVQRGTVAAEPGRRPDSGGGEAAAGAAPRGQDDYVRFAAPHPGAPHHRARSDRGPCRERARHRPRRRSGRGRDAGLRPVAPSAALTGSRQRPARRGGGRHCGRAGLRYVLARRRRWRRRGPSRRRGRNRRPRRRLLSARDRPRTAAAARAGECSGRCGSGSGWPTSSPELRRDPRPPECV